MHPAARLRAPWNNRSSSIAGLRRRTWPCLRRCKCFRRNRECARAAGRRVETGRSRRSFRFRASASSLKKSMNVAPWPASNRSAELKSIHALQSRRARADRIIRHLPRRVDGFDKLARRRVGRERHVQAAPRDRAMRSRRRAARPAESRHCRTAKVDSGVPRHPRSRRPASSVIDSVVGCV